MVKGIYYGTFTAGNYWIGKLRYAQVRNYKGELILSEISCENVEGELVENNKVLPALLSRIWDNPLAPPIPEEESK